MNNCLVKKLNVSADNNHLPIYGELKLKINLGNNRQYIRANTSDDCQVSGESGIVFKNSGLSETYPNPFQLTDGMNYGFFVVPSQEAYITISNKYSLGCLPNVSYKFGFTGVSDIVGGIESIVVPSNTKIFEFPESTMPLDIEDLVYILNRNNIESLEELDLLHTGTGDNLTGNISSFVRQGLKKIEVSGNTNIYGNIISFGSLTTLESIGLRACNVSGTIESFVAAQRAAGRTTGSVSGSSAGWGNITFNGGTTDAKGAVSWTATTITMHGVTIDA